VDQVFVSNILLLLILTLSVLGKNNSLAISVAFLLFISLIGQVGGGFEVISKNILMKSEKYGLHFGIIILMIGLLAPLALGKMNFTDIIELGKNKAGIIAIFSGILVAVFASKGGSLLENDPQITFALVIGTIIGVIIFKGYPVGPLIASGITAIILELVNIFHKQ